MVAWAGCLSMPLLRHHLAPFSAKLFAINSSRIPPQPKPPSGAKSGLGNDVRFTVLPGRDHDILDVYKNQELLCMVLGTCASTEEAVWHSEVIANSVQQLW